MLPPLTLFPSYINFLHSRYTVPNRKFFIFWTAKLVILLKQIIHYKRNQPRRKFTIHPNNTESFLKNKISNRWLHKLNKQNWHGKLMWGWINLWFWGTSSFGHKIIKKKSRILNIFHLSWVTCSLSPIWAALMLEREMDAWTLLTAAVFSRNEEFFIHYTEALQVRRPMPTNGGFLVEMMGKTKT